MVGAFGELAEGEMGDPEALAGDVSTALVTTAGGIVVSVIGIILAIVFLVPFLLKFDKDKKAAFSENFMVEDYSSDEPKRWNKWGTLMMISAVAIVLSPIFGAGIKLVKHFNKLGEEGGADPAVMAGGISNALEFTGISFILTSISAGVALICLLLFLRQKKLDEKAYNDATRAE